MRLSVFIVCLGVFLFSGMACVKSSDPCTNNSVESEEPAILAFAASNGITAVKHSSGLYYEIINPGSAEKPTLSSLVSANYTGKLTNGNIFEQTTTPAQFILGQTIAGWQLGVPLIGKGGSIKLIIPSALAYGCTGVGPIPGNSVLYFEVTLEDFSG